MKNMIMNPKQAKKLSEWKKKYTEANLIDIGVNMPPFLLPVVKYIKKQVEDKAKLAEDIQEVQEE